MKAERWLPAAAVGLACLIGCPRDEPPPELDRTLLKLKEEAERSAARPGRPTPTPTGAPSEDPNAGLALLAAGEKPAEKGPVRLPSAADVPVNLGTVAVKLLALSSAQAVGGGKVSLTTEETFLKVQLVAQNASDSAAPVDFGFARVVDPEGRQWALARDAQRLAGTNPVSRPLGAGERREYGLYFEVPRGGPEKGWMLLLPAAVGNGNEDVRIPLG